ncbi:hypothetical protein GCM10007423_39820 [Dyadobacter endophyticus]|uniref:Colicin import membrane protein n=1 Tax=Dyadobacter endophyticus TaxID=1749036 RepID=A0ABQ1Z0G3_9BACT|nr:hypothetical protein [Dyadobacter endophyticus]GGH42861.1 hypothetical protein GCM10007423_39820 [Dyadobacter endophyticus]
MTPEEKAEAAAKAAAEKEAADKAAAEKKAQEEAAAKAAAEKEAADKAAAAEAKKSAKKKTIADLKSSDEVVVTFKNPVAVSEDGENSITKEVVKQHVKYAFWQGLKKDDKGNPTYSTLRGAKLFGYVDDSGKVIEF